MPSILITAPGHEPVTLDEMKLHLRVDFNSDDTLIEMLIVAARKRAETITRRALVTQTWKQVLDEFPRPNLNIGSANWYGPQWGNSPGPLTMVRPDGKTGFELYLDHSPLASVSSVVYIDANGATQALDKSAYKVDVVSSPGRLMPAYGTTWPTTRNEINAVEVTYTAGYGDPDKVPEPIKSWIKMRVGAMYENREEMATGRGLVAIDMPFVDGLLEDYRVLVY